MFIWAQCIVELKFVGSGRSSRLCLLRLNSWPNSSMLGLVGRQIQVYLESKHDRTQYVDLSVDCLLIIGSF
jgi:hypothetical protein